MEERRRQRLAKRSRKREAETRLLHEDSVDDEQGEDRLQPPQPRPGPARRPCQQSPSLHLTLHKLQGSLLSVHDVRDLVLYSVLGPVCEKPKWCHFRPWKKTAQTVVIRASLDETRTPLIEQYFERTWVKMNSTGEDCEFWEMFLRVPLSRLEMLKAKVENASDDVPGKVPLLLRDREMLDLGYPFPDGVHVFATHKRYRRPGPSSPVFALDCEMCLTSLGHELTRVSLLTEDGRIVLDTLVKPDRPIVDYLTCFSGITAQLLAPVDVRLEDVQRALAAILPDDAILVGHSLEFCIDVGRVFNLSGNARQRSSLKTLAFTFLGEEIQTTNQGHCSVQDAAVALRLFKLKLANGEAVAINRMEEQSKSLVDAIAEAKKTLLVCLPDTDESARSPRCSLWNCKSFSNDAAMVSAVREVLLNQALCMLQLTDSSMDSLVLSLISSAARHSLIVFVLSTQSQSILYAKVKP